MRYLYEMVNVGEMQLSVEKVLSMQATMPGVLKFESSLLGVFMIKVLFELMAKRWL